MNDKLEKADAIVVLGGGLQQRPFEAARLYHLGFAPRVLIVKVRRNPTDTVGITKGETESMTEVVLRQGVPANAISVIGESVSNTSDESLAVARWAKSSSAKSVIIPTDLFHSRRAKWIFTKRLKTTATNVRVVALSASECDSLSWWKTEGGVLNFQNEVLKFIYYVLKY
ncbi:MAG: YdcF family protein [Verrucomicrobia bacterium]|nr:YdcF family protein [Verrucomicrobiota bacterium]